MTAGPHDSSFYNSIIQLAEVDGRSRPWTRVERCRHCVNMNTSLKRTHNTLHTRASEPCTQHESFHAGLDQSDESLASVLSRSTGTEEGDESRSFWIHPTTTTHHYILQQTKESQWSRWRRYDRPQYTLTSTIVTYCEQSSRTRAIVYVPVHVHTYTQVVFRRAEWEYEIDRNTSFLDDNHTWRNGTKDAWCCIHITVGV